MSSDLEDRVRRALDARARQITPERLRPALPPTATAPARWSWPPSWRSVLLTAATAAVAVLVFWRPDIRPDPAPGPPAGPIPSAPSPTPSARPTLGGGATAPASTQPSPSDGSGSAATSGGVPGSLSATVTPGAPRSAGVPGTVEPSSFPATAGATATTASQRAGTAEVTSTGQ